MSSCRWEVWFFHLKAVEVVAPKTEPPTVWLHRQVSYLNACSLQPSSFRLQWWCFGIILVVCSSAAACLEAKFEAASFRSWHGSTCADTNFLCSPSQLGARVLWLVLQTVSPTNSENATGCYLLIASPVSDLVWEIRIVAAIACTLSAKSRFHFWLREYEWQGLDQRGAAECLSFTVARTSAARLPVSQ